MHRIEHVRIGAEKSDYDKNVKYLQEQSRAAWMRCNLPPEPSKTTQRLRGGFTSKRRSEEPPAAVPDDPAELAVCDLSEIELARVHARAARVVSIDQGGIVTLEDEATTERIKAYCHDKVTIGTVVFYVTIEETEFSQRYKILGKKVLTND